MDRLEAMHAFVTVADLRGFAPAARKLRLSPSAVTRLIAALEEHLGARLLQRTTRNVALTDVGTRYLERARRVLADVEEAESSAQAERSAPSGRLVVSAPVGFGRRHVSPVVSTYLSRYPGVSCELRLADRMVNLVEDGIDLAFRTGVLQDSTLIARKLGSTHRLLCASSDYLARHGVPEGPSDLARHDCVIAGPSVANAHWMLEGPRGQKMVTVSGRFAANEMQAVVAAAVAGYGIAQLPHAVAEALIDEGRLRRVLEGYATPAGGLYVLYPSSRHLSPLVKAFIDLASQRISKRVNSA